MSLMNSSPVDEFFRRNEKAQNELAMHILCYIPLAGLTVLIAWFAGLYTDFGFISPLVMTLVPGLIAIVVKVWLKKDPYSPKIKYFVVFSVELSIFVLSISRGFSPFLSYAIVPLVSCLYFNKKCTSISCAVSYLAMLISIIIRAQQRVARYTDGITPLDWGVAYSVGLTIEYLVNVFFIHFLSQKHIQVISANIDGIETMQRTQDALVISYSNLIFQAHQSEAINTERVQRIVEVLCDILKGHRAFPNLSKEEYVSGLLSAVPLHNIGLIGVSDVVFTNPPPYSGTMLEEYKKHTIYGEELIRKNFYLSENREFLKIARNAALYHHERWDGGGYPEGLVGETIPDCARIIAVADELDRRLTGEEGHLAVSFDVALLQMQKLAGYTLDPVVVEALIAGRQSLQNFL